MLYQALNFYSRSPQFQLFIIREMKCEIPTNVFTLSLSLLYFFLTWKLKEQWDVWSKPGGQPCITNFAYLSKLEKFELALILLENIFLVFCFELLQELDYDTGNNSTLQWQLHCMCILNNFLRFSVVFLQIKFSILNFIMVYCYDKSCCWKRFAFCA